MSMREYPSSGYVVLLSDLKLILPEDKQGEFDGLLVDLNEGDKDIDEVSEWLTANLSEKFPGFDIYRPGSEDTPDDDNMEEGVYYAIFNDDDLYVKQETPEHTAMKKLGVIPKFSRWSVWG